MNTLPQLCDLDTRIWEEELHEFVPEQVYDIHTHIYRWSDNLDIDKDSTGRYEIIGKPYPHAGWDALDQVDRMLMPGRSVTRLSFPFPFPEPCAFEKANDFVAREVMGHKGSGALMLVKPSMSREYVADEVSKHGFLGFKPYRIYSSTGDQVQCGITDFMPLHQIEVADTYGLIVMMHLAKRDGLCDTDNLRDLAQLCNRFPNVKWILAHCGRSYADWPIRSATHVIRGLPNVWYDTSSVCDSDSIAALIGAVGPDRIMYGSDDLPIGVMRGKYISFARGWAFISEYNQNFDLSHCDDRMTFVRYEQLCAMKRACARHSLNDTQIKAIFHDTAAGLINKIRMPTG